MQNAGEGGEREREADEREGGSAWWRDEEEKIDGCTGARRRMGTGKKIDMLIEMCT